MWKAGEVFKHQENSCYGLRLSSSLSPSLNLLQLTLTLLGQGPEAALQVGIVWGRQPSGARGVSGLQVARQVGN